MGSKLVYITLGGSKKRNATRSVARITNRTK